MPNFKQLMVVAQERLHRRSGNVEKVALFNEDGSPFGLQVATVHLDVDAIATAYSEPVVLVESPGPGRVLVGLSITYETALDRTQVEWANGGPGLWYGGIADSDHASLDFASSDLFSMSEDANRWHKVTETDYDGTAILEDVVNLPLTIACRDEDPELNTPIVESEIVDAGLGYVVGDTGFVDGYEWGEQGTLFEVLTVDEDGAVLTYSLSESEDGPAGYNPDNNPHTMVNSGTQEGIGEGFTINVTELEPPSVDLYVTLLYYVVATH